MSLPPHDFAQAMSVLLKVVV